MIYGSNNLTEKNFKKALRNGVRKFLFNNTGFRLPDKSDLVFYNCNNQRVPSTWYLWEKNQENLNHFIRKFPHITQLGPYDLTLALQKALYWSNFRTGFIHYTRETLFKDDHAYFLEELYPCSGSRLFLNHLRNRFGKKVSYSQAEVQRSPENLCGIFIVDDFQLVLYKHIVLKARSDKRFVFFCNRHSVWSGLRDMGVPAGQAILLDRHSVPYETVKISLLKLRREDCFVYGQLLAHWQEVCNWIQIAESMLKSGISKLLINEGENGVMGAVFGEVMRKHGVLTYNTMNGMKSGEAQDAHVSFDKWFIWGNKMKDMLVKTCGLSPEMFLISGHLMEDEISKYTYMHSPGTDRTGYRKVISYFSVSGKRLSKLESIQCIYDFAAQNNDILFLMRPHPSEKSEDMIYPPSGLDNVRWIEYNSQNSKTTLYDQLSVSDLSIVVGSTVALESKWFGVPCITHEKRDESLIYMVDEEIIFHTRNAEEFNKKMKFLLDNPVQVNISLHRPAEFIISSLTHE